MRVKFVLGFKTLPAECVTWSGTNWRNLRIRRSAKEGGSFRQGKRAMIHRRLSPLIQISRPKPWQAWAR